MMLLDTCFLIALEREARKRAPASASRFLDAYSEESLFVTTTIAGELACGVPDEEKEVWLQMIEGFTILPITTGVAWTYGRVFQDLRARGELMGANDLWIAASALHHGARVVTNNGRDFGRIAGLNVVEFV
jgi:tRNA(fMet)-specific endonuclease VapC